MIEQTLFLIQLLIIMGIVIFEFFNIMNEGQNYGIKGNFVLMVAFLLFFFLGKAILLSDPEKVLYTTLMFLETGLFYLHIAFFIAGIIFFVKNGSLVLTQQRERYIPEDNYRGMKNITPKM